MTLAKKSLLAFTFIISVIFLFIVLAYLSRVAIIKSLSEEKLKPYNTSIDCIDFTISIDLSVKINRLCLQTPQADLKLEDISLTLDLAAQQKIKHINISSISIQGTTTLFNTLKESSLDNKDLTAKQQLKAYLTQLSEINLPFSINVKEFSYLPFAPESVTEIQRQSKRKHSSIQKYYIGKFSAIKNTLKFSIADHQQNTVIKANISINQSIAAKLARNQLQVGFVSQLAPLKQFLLAHELPLPPATLKTIESITVNGDFESELHYQAEQLSLSSQLKALSISSIEGVKNSGPFALTGALNLNSKINLASDNTSTEPSTNPATILDIEFQKENSLQAQFSHQHLLNYLSKTSLSPELITLLNDNVIEQVIVNPYGSLSYDLNEKRLSLTGVTFNLAIKNNETKVNQLALSNININLNHYLQSENSHFPQSLSTQVEANKSQQNQLSSTGSNNTQQEAINEKLPTAELDFKFEMPLLISALKGFTHSPVILNLQGAMRQEQTKIIVSFDDSSTLTSNKISIPANQIAKNNKQLTIKQVAMQIQGNITTNMPGQVKESVLSNAQLKVKQSIDVNLHLNSQVNKLRYANVVEINSLSINSNIIGNIDDIKIHTAVIADNVPLGNLVVSGAVNKPKLVLTAKQLPLTDLLALNIKLPTDVKLVEGTLSYRVKGQITDLNNVQNSTLDLSVDVASLSGEIANIWVQELNWQQNFQYLNGVLTSLSEQNSPAQENLTVALIDTPTPISKLSINTRWHYENEFKISATKLSGDVLGGSFAIPKIQWPLDYKHSVDVQLTHIDLAQVLALDEKQGIVVTGNISGHLPIFYDGEKYTMENGELHNVSNGLIQIMNNPAVSKLKASNTQLQLAFDALQNLHYNQLSSDVSMADDGYMLLETVIKGRNPDIDNDVNLNLNLSYDLLGLLESMSITKQFEEKIIKGLQINKE